MTQDVFAIEFDSPYYIVWYHHEKHVLKGLQDEVDGKKIRNKPCIRVHPLALAKVFRFAQFMKSRVECADWILEQARAIVQANIKREELAARIRDQYPDNVEFDYDYKGIYDLYTHQKVMYNMTVQMDKCAILAKAGTCKTGPYLWAIDTRIKRNIIKKVLIVTLKACCPNIVDEIKIQAPHLTSVILKGGRGRCDKILNKKFNDKSHNHDYNIYITNYESMFSIYDLMEGYFDMVICDEAHRLGNPGSRITNSIIEPFDLVKYKAIVTGTLDANNYMSFFMPYRFLGPDVLPYANYYKFRSIYFRTVDRNGFIWKPNPGIEDKIRDIQSKISVYFDIEECMDLPGIMNIKRYCEMTPRQTRDHGRLEEELMTEFACKLCNKKDKCSMFNESVDAEDILCDGNLVLKNIMTKSIKLNQIASGFLRGEVEAGNIIEYPDNPKADLLRDELLSIGNEKVIIWTTHIPVKDMIINTIESEKELRKRKYLTVFGNDDAFKIVEKFKHEDYGLLVANQAKGGVGLNITQSHYEIFWNNDYSYIKRDQAIGRQYRGGQKEKVFVIDLICKHSVDELILDTINNKRGTADFLVSLVRLCRKKASSKRE